MQEPVLLSIQEQIQQEPKVVKLQMINRDTKEARNSKADPAPTFI